MLVYLTSFFRHQHLPSDIDRWSCAVYQPKGFKFPKATCFEIKDDSGKWIRPRDFLKTDDPVGNYFNTLLGLYQSRHEAITQWIDDRQPDPVILCCWCPYDKAAQRQLKQWGSFICHTWVIGWYLRAIGHTTFQDTDRLQMLPLTQKNLPTEVNDQGHDVA